MARVRRECDESADCCHSFVRRIGSPNLKCSCSANQREEICELVVKEALSKGDDERDKSKRKECGGTKKKEQLMGVIEQQFG
ncbi:hypothetical protein DEO72_LG10g224 [Vigna unguiculata]|uniref:Uncharacterized protein n=1 Tax=Vigna unguiculata TaxID=3917 RepID=A0A4D6NA43_VIGUN|nr:hypothetical protein DEO72_LG10g224 [Vigna unguiculata]